MATVEERAKAKREKAELISKGTTGEPLVNEATYRLDLMNALNYYSREDDKLKRKWAKEYLVKNSLTEEVKLLSEAPDWLVTQIGALCRLINRGQFISKEHESLITKKFIQIKSYVLNKNQEDEEIEKANALAPKPIDKNLIIFEQALSDIDVEIDRFIKTGTLFDIKGYLATNQINSNVANKISKYYTSTLKELNSVETDEQLAEGYSFLSKKRLNEFKLMIENIVNGGKQLALNNKVRKPRKKKVIPLSVIVGKLKYKKEFAGEGYTLISENPTNIVGAREVWMFNTQNRNLTVYKSNDGLQVKNSSILNYDVASSKTKKIRKPEVFFNTSFTKPIINNMFKELSSVDYTPNSGRTAEHMIIVKVFK